VTAAEATTTHLTLAVLLHRALLRLCVQHHITSVTVSHDSRLPASQPVSQPAGLAAYLRNHTAEELSRALHVQQNPPLAVPPSQPPLDVAHLCVRVSSSGGRCQANKQGAEEYAASQRYVCTIDRGSTDGRALTGDLDGQLARCKGAPRRGDTLAAGGSLMRCVGHKQPAARPTLRREHVEQLHIVVVHQRLM
jgi:hypothetical protein